MAVKNSLTKQQSFNNSAIEYESNGTMIKISPAIVRDYLTSGNGAVTDQEIVMFINLCKAQRLNPFLREAYLIKYGSQPASIVVGKEAFTKRARRAKDYAGQQAGVVVQKQDGALEHRIGSLVLKEETLVGGWAKVFVKGYETPVEITVSFDEYVGTKADGTINAQWAKKPGTMIRKVALAQALREAFPEELQGMYASEEVGVDEADIPDAPVELKEQSPAYEQPEREEYDPLE
jgi:phage recombination protein Bet